MADQESNNAYYGGGGGHGMSGSWSAIILVVVILWVLFRDGHKGAGDSAFGGNGCGPCVQPTFKDESNWEEESHLKDKLCFIDRDVIEQGCKTRETEMCEAEKTRALITHNQERADDKAYQALLYSNMQKDSIIQTQAIEMGFERKFDKVLAAIGATNTHIDRFECNTPQRPPFYACGGEPEVYPYPPRRNQDFPRRGGCCDDFGGSYA